MRGTLGTDTFNQWFNTSVVSVPVAGKAATSTTPAVQGQRRNAPKVNFYNPGVTNFDTALFKNFPLRDKATVQFRLETYNTFNHSEFNDINGAAVFANATTATASQTSGGFGQIDSTARPRCLQLARRINYSRVARDTRLHRIAMPYLHPQRYPRRDGSHLSEGHCGCPYDKGAQDCRPRIERLILMLFQQAEQTDLAHIYPQNS